MLPMPPTALGLRDAEKLALDKVIGGRRIRDREHSKRRSEQLAVVGEIAIPLSVICAPTRPRAPLFAVMFGHGFALPIIWSSWSLPTRSAW